MVDPDIVCWTLNEYLKAEEQDVTALHIIIAFHLIWPFIATILMLVMIVLMFGIKKRMA